MIRLRRVLWVLVALAAGLFVLFAVRLRDKQPEDDFIRSALIGKPLPEFALAPIVPDRPGLSSADFADGQPRLLNVFGSWCVPCRAEASQLDALERAGAEIVAIAIRDRPDDAAEFLANYGNPFTRIGRDDISEVQLELGSSGVPETFVVDGGGVIRHQHIGPIMDRDIPVLLAELREAGA